MEFLRHKYAYGVLGAVGVILGSFLGLLFIYPYNYWSLGAIAAVMCILVWRMSLRASVESVAISRDRHGLRPRDDRVKILSFIICLIVSFYFSNQQQINYTMAQNEIFSQKEFSGQIRVSPDLFEASQRVRLSLENNYRVEAYLPLLPIISRGESLTLNCFSISRPKYFWYGLAHKILGRCENPEIINNRNEKRETRGEKRDARSEVWGVVLGQADNARIFLLNRLSLFVPEPLSGFIGGLIFGTVAGVPEPVTDNLRLSGLSAILAVSGYNVTIIFAALGWLLIYLFRRPYKWIAIILSLALAVYILMVGFQTSVVRAGLMAGLWLGLTVLARLRSPLLALLYAGALLVIFNPASLLGDWGLWLSFSATWGILFWPRYLWPFFKKWKKIYAVPVVYLLGAQLGVYPVLLGLINQVPLFGGVALLVVSPAIPLLMLWGVSIMAASFLPWLFLPELLGRMSSFGGSIILSVAALASRLPNITLPVFWGIILALLFLAGEVFLYFRLKKNKVEVIDLPL